MESEGYYICHKCGLPRGSEGNVPDIGRCSCLGQTTFEYEEVLRSYEEAVKIAQECCKDSQNLFIHQGRKKWRIEQLLEKYAKIPEQLHQSKED